MRHSPLMMAVVVGGFSWSFLAGCSARDGAAGGSGTGGSTSGSTGGSGAGTGTGGGPVTGSGGTGQIDPGKGSAGQGGSSLSPDAACIAEPRQGEQNPIALFFMMDSSGSMETVDPGQTATRWVLINDAVQQFVTNTANAGIFAGLDFFPEPPSGVRPPSCIIADYESPNVPIDLLPGMNLKQANAFITAMSTRPPGGNTPTVPALQGALNTAVAFQGSHPGLAVSVVFTTDGQPNGCGSTVQDAAASAAIGLTANIKTYVLGVGPEAANLDAIAVAGGTKQAHLVTMGGSAALSAALNAIRTSSLSCDYKIPTLDGSVLSYQLVNVRTRIGSMGTFVDILKVDGAQFCGTSNGWYFDNPVPPGSPPPTTITLCPATCGPLVQTPGSQMDVLIGCQTRVRIIN